MEPHAIKSLKFLARIAYETIRYEVIMPQETIPPKKTKNMLNDGPYLDQIFYSRGGGGGRDTVPI